MLFYGFQSAHTPKRAQKKTSPRRNQLSASTLLPVHCFSASFYAGFFSHRAAVNSSSLLSYDLESDGYHFQLKMAKKRLHSQRRAHHETRRKFTANEQKKKKRRVRHELRTVLKFSQIIPCVMRCF